MTGASIAGVGADLRLHGDSHVYAPDLDEDPFAESPLVGDGIVYAGPPTKP